MLYVKTFVDEQMCKGGKDKSFFTTLKIMSMPLMDIAIFMVHVDHGFLR